MTTIEIQVRGSSRNYRKPLSKADATDWGASRETHPAIAMAIHAISSGDRSPEKIWESPTHAEFDHVVMAVQEYVRHGDFDAQEDGRYPWGVSAIEVG